MWYEDEDEDDVAMLVEDYSQPLLPPDQTSTPEDTIVRMSRAVLELTWRELRRLFELARMCYGSARRTDGRADHFKSLQDKAARTGDAAVRRLGEGGAAPTCMQHEDWHAVCRFGVRTTRRRFLSFVLSLSFP